MDYEKKYKESMAKMSTFLSKHDGFTISKDGEMYKEFSEIFPELKESEDERIRKHLIKHFGNKSKEDWNGVPVKSILAWLEKQCEKGTNGNEREFPIPEPTLTIKHAKEVMGIKQDDAWSEEDEKCLENAIMYCEWARDIAPNLYCLETSEKSIIWLKSLKDRVLPQSKQEWSDKDEKMIHHIENAIKYDKSRTYLNSKGIEIIDVCNWFKSLRPQLIIK